MGFEIADMLIELFNECGGIGRTVIYNPVED